MAGAIVSNKPLTKEKKLSAHTDWAEYLCSMNPESLSIEVLREVKNNAGDLQFGLALEQLRRQHRRSTFAVPVSTRVGIASRKASRATNSALGGLIARMSAVLSEGQKLPPGRCMTGRVVAHVEQLRDEARIVVSQ